MIVINPIVPYVNDFASEVRTLRGSRPRRVSDMGFPQIGYQAFKLLAHQRLHEMASRWEERYPGVDIVLIEPEPTDELMFQTSMMSFSSRIEIARHGFQSVTYHLRASTSATAKSPSATGSRSPPSGCARVVEHFEPKREEHEVERLAQDPRGHHRRAAAPEQPAESRRRLKSAERAGSDARCSRRSEAAALRSAMRTWRGSPSAAPAATSTPARSRRAASSPPSSVGWATHRKLAWLSVTSKPRSRSSAVSRVRSRDAPHMAREQIGAGAQRLQRARLRELVDTEVGLELGQQLLRAGPAERVADAQSRQAPSLGEAAEDEQAWVVLQQRERGVGRLGVGELDERLVQQHRHALGQTLEQPLQLVAASSSPGRVVGAGERHHARVVSAAASSSASAAPPLTGTARPWARRAMIGNSG